jgi:hypothetical protein
VSTNHDNSTYGRLIEGLGEVPPKWNHDKDLIVGRVVDLDSYTGEFGSCKTIVIEAAAGSTEDGGSPIPVGESRTVYASRTVLANKTEKALERGLKIGDRIAMKHFGRPEGREYENYDLKFEAAVAVESDIEADTSDFVSSGQGELPPGF